MKVDTQRGAGQRVASEWGRFGSDVAIGRRLRDVGLEGAGAEEQGAGEQQPGLS